MDYLDLLTPKLTENVLSAMAEAAAVEIMPRWQSLKDSEIRTKSGPQDLVTDADVGAERLLTERLQQIIPIPVVGEEATAQRPELPQLIGTAPACWIVDPVDGTANFVHGKADFACMVALQVGAHTHGAWITYPARERTATALRGQGTYLDGQRWQAPTPTSSTTPNLRGALGVKFALGTLAPTVVARAESLGPAADIRFCAGWDYLDLLTGATDYVFFSRTLPWDHAPGALLAQEAGLRSARPDGSEYFAGDSKKGLLSAHPEVWDRVSTTLAVTDLL